uniref:Strictosidine synthase conserved region domain-containing protein n=1 Tax=Chenopodium quinoa TaxID=63459 RepID=A0A803MAP7_CHEQI
MNKEISLLTNEAAGKKFKCTDGVDIARDGTIYFTDASYKYGFHNYLNDILEYRPYGRLLSYDNNTRETKVLLEDLYFPNGVTVSPDQNSLIFCETPLKRCKTYWIQGSRKGEVDVFIDNLPGFPDNIHSDGQNRYWIAMSSWLNPYFEQARHYRFVRKSLLIMDRYISKRHIQRNGGILGVDLEGNPTVHVYDPAMSLITSGIKIEDHLYIGSLNYDHIIRFNLSSLSSQHLPDFVNNKL